MFAMHVLLSAAVGSSQGGGAWSLARPGGAAPVALAAAVPVRTEPDTGELHDPQDPTDSLWRAARQALQRGEYAGAATLFSDVNKRFPSSSRAGDALYWAAFALYKSGDAGNLRVARTTLATQQSRYPKAPTLHDGEALLARIQAALAQQGDAEAAAWVAVRARGSADTGGGARTCPSEDENNDIRIQALNGLQQMDPESALPILRKVLARRDPCSTSLRRRALFIVSQSRSSETEDILVDVARHDPNEEVREQAVFWMSQVSTERAVVMLDSILRSATDPQLVEKALFALSQQSMPRAAQSLRDYAERSDAPLDARAKAIFWIGQQQSGESAAFLRGLYAKLGERELKEKVIFSLSQTHSAENTRWLMELTVNEREPLEMRKKALFWAGQEGANMEELGALYDRLQSVEMKEQLIFVYSQRHEPAALDRLIRIAKTEREPELRKKAIFWLGQSNDPRAAQVLLEIINQ